MLALETDPFTREQSAFPIQSSAKTADFSMRRQNAMAGHEHRDRVRPARAADGADRPGFANSPGDFAVAFRLAEGDFPEFGPDGPLKFRAAGQIELRQVFRRA